MENDKLTPNGFTNNVQLARFAGILGLLTILAALFAFAVNVPSQVVEIQYDWGVSAAYQAVEGFATIEGFSTYILVMRLLAAGIMLTAAAVLLSVGKGKPLALLASMVFSAAAPIFGLTGDGLDSSLPPPYAAIFNALSVYLVMVFIGGIVFLGQVYPTGKHRIKWIKKISPWLGGGLILWALVIFSGAADSFGDMAWMVFIVLLFSNIVLAVWSILSRLLKPKSEIPGYGLLGLGVLFGWLFVTIMFSEAMDTRPFLRLISLHLDLLAVLVLAGGIFRDIWKHRLWEINLQPHRRLLIGTAAGMVLLSVSVGLASARQALAAQASGFSLAEELVDRKIGPLLVDTDMGNDDVLALLFLMEHPGVDLQAITVVGTGLVHCEPGVRNVLGLLELAEHEEIPVSCGSEAPFGAEHEFPTPWRMSADRLWGLNLSTGGRQPGTRTAPEVIADYLRESEKPATILSLGPLTNFAEVFRVEPDLVEKVGMLYQMGGAVEVPGNVFDENLGLDNRTAEWNIYADPEAARIVFETGVPITLIPLDATNDVPVDMGLFRQFEERHDSRVSTFIFNIFYINQGWIQSGYYYLWDTVASAALTTPEVVVYENYNLRVITESGPDYGRTAVDAAGEPVRVAVQADPGLFKALFVHILRGP